MGRAWSQRLLLNVMAWCFVAGDFTEDYQKQGNVHITAVFEEPKKCNNSLKTNHGLFSFRKIT